MPDEESAKQPGATEAEQGCPVKMHEGGRCGRPVHKAPEGVDKAPVCLMHSRDISKDDAAFHAEFEKILQSAGARIADFTGFVFPGGRYASREFKARCVFSWSTFAGGADFSWATFTQDADFWGATFTRDAKFFAATFTQNANFLNATFSQGASFNLANFAGHANFGGATFTQRASFGAARFVQGALFGKATFPQGADFAGATFTEDAGFWRATFTQGADFSRTTFAEHASFSEATFTEDADFRDARFRGEVEFRATVFRHDETREAGPIFARARFEKPEAVLFYKTYLGQALFYNCDVSKFVFSDVRWGRRKWGIRSKLRSGKIMVFEEVVGVKPADPVLDGIYYAKALRPGRQGSDERNYGLIAELYQQLKKNYDDRRDYWTAGDFHYGEMEMKRLHSPSRNRLVRQLHRHLGLVAWYKYASEYGESYMRPALLLLSVLALFALLYPWRGLEFDFDAGKGPEPAAAALKDICPEIESPVVLVLTYGHPCGDQAAGNWRARFYLIGHSALTALYVAAFQKEIVYEPNYPAGRAFALLEALLTSTLIALFLLAVRRQFRR